METTVKLPAVLAILATTLFWGLSYSSTKVLLGTLHPIQIAFYRLILASIVLGAFFIVTKKQAIHNSDLLRVAAGGVFGTFIYFLFENNGLRFTTAGTGSLIIATIPVLNVIAGAIFYREKNTPIRWLGVILSFFGVYLIIHSGGGNTLTLANLKGNSLVFGAACSWVAYTRINVTLTERYDSITINLYQAMVGMIFLGILTIPIGVDFSVLKGAVLFNLAYLGIFCSAVAYLLYLFALKRLGAAAITSFINLVPVFGVLGGAIILHEALVTGQLLGGAVVITGVTLVTMSGKSRDTAPIEII